MKIEIPKRFQSENFNFVLLSDDGKIPVGQAWQKKILRYDNPILQKHLEAGKNVGIQGNNSYIEIGGVRRHLIFIDFDMKSLQDKILDKFPETLTTTSGSSKSCVHLWLASDKNTSFKVLDKDRETKCDVLGAGKQLVAPGSKHCSGSIYRVVKDVPIAFMEYKEIEKILRSEHEYKTKPKKKFTKTELKGVFGECYNSVSMEDVLKYLGIDTSSSNTGCYFHNSTKGKCLAWNEETAHCFHCEGAWNKYSLIREALNLSDKQTIEWFCDQAGRIDELNKERKNFNPAEVDYTEIDKDVAEVFSDVFIYAKKLYGKRPYVYDTAKNFWFWNHSLYKYERVDETELLITITKRFQNINTIDSKTRNELLESLRQYGRAQYNQLKKPKETWIQFKDEIIDYVTREKFKATSEYLVTNSLPWKQASVTIEEAKTPMIDKLFREWVGEDYVLTLKEISAYCCLSGMPIHRIICLIGKGRNGKGSFTKFIYKLVGEDNKTATELEKLIGSRFEIIKLYKKLVCSIGEIDKSVFKKTAQLKALSGENELSGEYKGKDSIDFKNYAKPLIETNTLPESNDKTDGFYSRWCIVDFPNQFEEGPNPVNQIPEEEFENFCCLVPKLLNDLIARGKFHKEGSIQERKERYEEHSNPLDKFIEEYLEKDVNSFISFADFKVKFDEYLQTEGFRKQSSIELSKSLKNKKFETKNKTWTDTFGTHSCNVIYGLKFKYEEQK